MKNNMLINLKRNVSIAGLKLKKHAPTILVVAGAVGTVGSTIMACKATIKLPDILDECSSRKDEIEAHYVDALECTPDDVDVVRAYKKDITKVTVANAIEIGKLYAPAVSLGVASLSIIFAANNIQRKRNASLAAAYATLDSMYRKYRKNVVETFGEDVDHDMRFGIKHEKVDAEVEDENGKKHKIKKVIDIVDPEDPSNYSDYARFFDSSIPGWDQNPEINMLTLKAHQSYCNQLLKSRGYLFLNDVYKILGFDSSMAGQSVGWIYDKENDLGDGYIDFHIFDNKQANRRFVNGYEPVILLDFNPDGDLLNNPKLNSLLMKKISRK